MDIMSGDIKALLAYEKNLIIEGKNRLDLIKDAQLQYDNVSPNTIGQSFIEKDTSLKASNLEGNGETPLIEPLDLKNSFNGSVNGAISNRTAFDVENALSFRSDDSKTPMLRYGEYSPNNPQLRVKAAPYLGLGEYEQRRQYFLEKQRSDYSEYLTKLKNDKKSLNDSYLTDKCPISNKAVQTDIQNIHSLLVQYEDFLQKNSPKRELIQERNYNNFKEPFTQNDALLLNMDCNKPKSILSNRRTGSCPRTTTYTPSFMDGFSYQDRNEELERERMKRETYQHDLRLQIEEKRHLQQLREEQERREQELENRRLEQQLLRMQEEQMVEEQRRCRRDEQMRRHSDDLLRRKHELQSRLRRHTELDCINYRNSPLITTTLANTGRTLSHYSPPIQRRNMYNHPHGSATLFAPSRYDTYNYNRRGEMLNRMDSLQHNSNYTKFNRFDSLSRIDTLNHQKLRNDDLLLMDRLETLSIQDSLCNVIHRRHSATQQDLSMFSSCNKKSPKLQRRSNSSRFDDTLPIPVLKAHSPVAKELKNSIPFNSTRYCSEAVRKLDDKWQVPAVQKNIVNYSELRDGHNKNILTQLGAIRMQLQQEQLRMDEQLRKRDFTQSKAVDYH